MIIYYLAAGFDPEHEPSSGHCTRKWMNTETKFRKLEISLCIFVKWDQNETSNWRCLDSIHVVSWTDDDTYWGWNYLPSNKWSNKCVLCVTVLIYIYIYVCMYVCEYSHSCKLIVFRRTHRSTPFWHPHWRNYSLHTLEEYESSTENTHKMFNWRNGDYFLSLKKLFVFRKSERCNEEIRSKCREIEGLQSRQIQRKKIVNKKRYS